MKKLLFTTLAIVPLALFADTPSTGMHEAVMPVNGQPAVQSPQPVPVQPVVQPPQSVTVQPAENLPVERPSVRLQMEIVPSEVAPLGLDVKKLQSDLTDKLIKSNILVKDDPNSPLLVLRVKTITHDKSIATFLQLAFFEDAELSRNKMTVLAMTWSQASLIATNRDDFSKEAMKNILAMTSSFITDYQKAFQPKEQANPVH